jgi:hypothetical protein
MAGEAPDGAWKPGGRTAYTEFILGRPEDKLSRTRGPDGL